MLNYMLYFRGNPEDFDEWEELGREGAAGPADRSVFWLPFDKGLTRQASEPNAGLQIEPHFHEEESPGANDPAEARSAVKPRR